MTDEKASSSVPLMILTAVAVVCFALALGMFLMFSFGLFSHYDFSVGATVGASPLLALIPLFIGVIAGVGALLLWGVQKR